MTDTEKIAYIKVLVQNDEDATDATLIVYLNLAKNAVLNTMYPLGVPEDVTDVPAQYETLECELASRYFLRRGGQGELTHEENGIARTYASVDDIDLLEKITPFAGVL